MKKKLCDTVRESPQDIHELNPGAIRLHLSLSEDANEHPFNIQAGFRPGGLFLPASVLLISALLVFFYIVFIVPAYLLSDEDKPAVLSEEDDSGTSASNTKIAALFSPEVRRWEPQLVAWAQEASLDPNLLATVMQIESCGDSQAVSVSGAMGLFQVMPFHFEDGEDAFDPATNARRGANYLRQAYDARNGDVRAAFASYNGGINGASRPESEWTDEMLRYAHWGTGIYTDAQKGGMNSPVLQEWLAAGGSSLCAQAGQSQTAQITLP